MNAAAPAWASSEVLTARVAALLAAGFRRHPSTNGDPTFVRGRAIVVLRVSVARSVEGFAEVHPVAVDGAVGASLGVPASIDIDTFIHVVEAVASRR